MPATVDLHLHTTASDGSFAPAQLVALLRQKGIRTFAVTDHDAVEGAVEMQAIVPPDLRFIPGVEFSCRSAVGKYHILGYGFDPRHPAVLAAVEEGRQLRRQKQAQRIRWLEEQHGIRLTEEELRWLNSRKSPGKPHLGRILLDRGLDTEGAGMMGVLRRYVNGFKGGNDRIGGGAGTGGGFQGEMSLDPASQGNTSVTLEVDGAQVGVSAVDETNTLLVRATASACSSVCAPATLTVTRRVAPSPSEAILRASVWHTAIRARSNRANAGVPGPIGLPPRAAAPLANA